MKAWPMRAKTARLRVARTPPIRTPSADRQPKKANAPMARHRPLTKTDTTAARMGASPRPTGSLVPLRSLIGLLVALRGAIVEQRRRVALRALLLGGDLLHVLPG